MIRDPYFDEQGKPTLRRHLLKDRANEHRQTGTNWLLPEDQYVIDFDDQLDALEKHHKAMVRGLDNFEKGYTVDDEGTILRAVVNDTRRALRGITINDELDRNQFWQP